jgi:hypothetical protein
MKVTPQKCLIGLVAIALLLTFGQRSSESEPGQSAVVTLIDVTRDTVVMRMDAKRQIALDVAAGRRSLVEAAALFRELNRLPPAAADLTVGDREEFVLHAAVHNDEERLCRQVVEWVYWTLLKHVSAESAEEAVARLEAEFRAAPRADGVIRLPDPSALTPLQNLLDPARAGRATR